MTAAIITQTTVPLAELVDDWLISLEANGKSQATLKAYAAGVRGFLRWHGQEFPAAEPMIDRKTVELWLTDLRRAGKAPGSRRLWSSAIRLFTAWLAHEDVAELDRDPLEKMKLPSAGKPLVRCLPDDEIDRLLQACRGTSFADRRDKALVYVLASTGLRAGECMALNVGDVNFGERKIYVHHGKGDKERKVPLTPKTAEAVKAYLRARRGHRLAQTGTLWLGEMSRPFGYQGAARALGNRAKAAGIEGFHLHRFRHSFASRFKQKGGSDDELMALAGWSDPTMARLYTQDTVRERALKTALGMDLDKF